MGLIDFVKEAGQKLGLGGGGAHGKESDEPQASDEELLEEAETGRRLWQLVVDLGLEVEEFQVTFDDGVATLYGTCPTQAAREKVILAIGNTRGVARVDDRLEVEAPEPEATFYTVVAGDTLSKIALAHYESATEYPRIFEANRPMLKSPDLIYPGQVLRIPPK